MHLSNRTKRSIGIGIPAIAIIALAVLAYVYRARLRVGLDLLVEETGSRTMAAVCVALALFALVCLLFWMLFPILVYLGLRDLRRRTTELDESTQLCARHLAQLARDRERPQEKKVTTTE